jgi:hypothetical protein
MDANRHAVRPRQLGTAAIDLATHGVGSVRRDAKLHPSGGEPGKVVELPAESLHGGVGVRGVHVEHLVMGDSRCVEGVERGNHRPAVPHVADGRDAGRPAVTDPVLRGVEEVLLIPGRLERDDVLDPVPEDRVIGLAGETGELEMGVGVDQPGEENAVGEVLAGSGLRHRDRRLGADRGDPAVIVDEHGAVGDRWRTHRHHPRRGEPPHQEGGLAGLPPPVLKGE